MSKIVVITQAVSAEDLDAEIPVRLMFDADDPFVVRAHFLYRPLALEVPWLWGRAEMRQGLSGLSGIGDVVFWPSGGERLVIRLAGTPLDQTRNDLPQDGDLWPDSCLIFIPLEVARDFIEASDRLCPPSAEGEVMERDLARLLGE